MPYVDIFVVPVLKSREDEYRSRAEQVCKIWLECGALSYAEHRAEDLPDAKLTGFTLALKLQPDEIPYVAITGYRDRAHRDAVRAKLWKDPRAAAIYTDNPSDKARLFSGGFETAVASG